MPTSFTPVSALIGGALIGLAATYLLATLGRIAGISGIVNAAVDRREERGWRLAFLVGMVAAAGAWFAWSGAVPRTDFPWAWLVIAGLLVGFGTRLGNGCTSGHGICGLARFSKRSLWAVAVFMGSAFVTVYLVRHVAGASP
ncbi:MULTISPECIES: YeeE/YedE family protein [unclassified Lysobacter]|uniref:YeeE/YedE family protein n=1 Tax=unclassified Lysobacter TaxID=2635362 RepID=UPI001C2477CA|nr:YeeE/YedE family protein [Lysobacter sp. MMG2]MBU8976813.1 YeeE/YedE family protein [Lysobacter sp. MMG2]